MMHYYAQHTPTRDLDAPLLGIEEPQKLAFMVAFGSPTHKAAIVPMTEQTGIKYYLDENRDYCVPKRSAEEIARSL